MEQLKQHTILKIQNLSIGYSSKKRELIIQKNLNLILKTGTLTCLIGNNGVGKSTLLRTLANMQSALSGNILINNKAIKAFTPLQLSKKISLVLTESIPPTNLTVFELVALGRQPYTNWLGNLSSSDRKMIDKAMQQTQIIDIATKKIYQLSDGQKQRTMIARALAQDTPIIILDEPTVHLDINHKIAILKLLQELCKTLNKTIIIATHEVSFATQLADIIWLMRIDVCLAGTPDELIANRALQDSFNSDLISFDDDTRQFNIKK